MPNLRPIGDLEMLHLRPKHASLETHLKPTWPFWDRHAGFTTHQRPTCLVWDQYTCLFRDTLETDIPNRRPTRDRHAWLESFGVPIYKYINKLKVCKKSIFRYVVIRLFLNWINPLWTLDLCLWQSNNNRLCLESKLYPYSQNNNTAGTIKLFIKQKIWGLIPIMDGHLFLSIYLS